MRSGPHENLASVARPDQVKISKEDLAWPKLRPLHRLRLLDLDDKLRGFKN